PAGDFRKNNLGLYAAIRRKFMPYNEKGTFRRSAASQLRLLFLYFGQRSNMDEEVQALTSLVILVAIAASIILMLLSMVD
ncbi:MAG: hypothetical protein EBU57_13195, partial [Alphaproteobacteria bacterium]|nr:hypothetical protein [Alphaproteobacteria bacterium]